MDSAVKYSGYVHGVPHRFTAFEKFGFTHFISLNVHGALSLA